MSILSYEMLKNLKSGEFAVYNYIMSHMESIPSMNIRELAEATGVSTTTVMRFCERAGCAGYTELKYRIKCGMSEHRGKINYDVVPALQFIKNSEQDELFREKLAEVSEFITQSAQVVFSGDREGRAIARYGAYLFNHTGKMAFLCEGENGRACPCKDLRSVLFLLSASGKEEEIVSLANRYKEAGAFVVSITNTEQCPVASMSDVGFACYMPETYRREMGAVRTSQLPAVYILECLAALI